MKFTIGDRVVMKRTGEEGVITAIHKKGLLEIDIAGIVFPAFEDEVDHPYLRWFLEQRKKQPAATSSSAEMIPVERPKTAATRAVQGVQLQFVPQFATQGKEEIIAGVSIHLVYDLAEAAHFFYEARRPDGALIFTLSTVVQPFANLLLHALPLEAMNEAPRLLWQLSAPGAQGRPAAALKAGELRIRAARLARHVSDLVSGEAPSFSYPLTDSLDVPTPQSDIANPAAALAFKKPATPAQQGFPLPPPRHEVDLHIDALTDHAKTMQVAEMLALQRDTLEYFVWLAIAHSLPGMVVIHGIGNGALKKLVADFLKTVPEVAGFSQDWAPGYGYGGTAVVFR